MLNKVPETITVGGNGKFNAEVNGGKSEKVLSWFSLCTDAPLSSEKKAREIRFFFWGEGDVRTQAKRDFRPCVYSHLFSLCMLFLFNFASSGIFQVPVFVLKIKGWGGLQHPPPCSVVFRRRTCIRHILQKHPVYALAFRFLWSQRNKCYLSLPTFWQNPLDSYSWTQLSYHAIKQFLLKIGKKTNYITLR